MLELCFCRTNLFLLKQKLDFYHRRKICLSRHYGQNRLSFMRFSRLKEHLSYQESPKMLEQVFALHFAFLFSSQDQDHRLAVVFGSRVQRRKLRPPNPSSKRNSKFPSPLLKRRTKKQRAGQKLSSFQGVSR